MSAAAGVPADDLGRALGFASPWRWTLCVLFVAVMTYQATVLGGPSGRGPSGLTALVIVVVAAVVLTLAARTPLPPARTAVVVIAVVASVALVTFAQPFHDRPPGYVAWDLGAANGLLFALTIRGRIAAAWIGEAVLLAVVAGWSTGVTGSPLYGLGFAYGQPISLAACTVFAIGLHRTGAQIVAYRDARRERADLEARGASSAPGHDADLVRVRTLVGPTLAAIAADRGPSPREVLVLEGTVRDLIRGRSLAREPLADAVRRARERGVDVVLLDDLDGDPGHPSGPLDAALGDAARVLAGSSAAALTVRLARDDGVVHLTVVADGEPVEVISITPAQETEGLPATPSDGRL